MSELDKEVGEPGKGNGIVNCQVLDSMLLGDNRDLEQNEAEREHKKQEGRVGEMEIEGLLGDIYVKGSVRPSLRELNIKVNVEGGNQYKDQGKLKNRTWKRIDKREKKEKAHIYDLNKENVDDKV